MLDPVGFFLAARLTIAVRLQTVPAVFLVLQTIKTACIFWLVIDTKDNESYAGTPESNWIFW
jgi:threonine/homoserine/homoserine lactone efflux protein